MISFGKKIFKDFNSYKGAKILELILAKNECITKRF